MKHPFQAVTVRYVHDVLTGEFLNIGVVLLCPDALYAGARFLSLWSRVTAAFPNAEPPHLRRIASVVENACAQFRRPPGSQLRLPGERDVVAFLAGVIPPDDASIQVSPVIRGVTDDPNRTLAELHKRYAERYIEDTTRPARSDGQVWQDFARRLAPRVDLLHRLVPFTLKSPRSPGYQYEFEKAWKNGKWNVAQPISLDLVDPRAIREKATQWTGRVVTLHPSEQGVQLAFLVGMPPETGPEQIRQAARDAVQILDENLEGEAWIVTENRADELAQKIQRDLEDPHA